MSLDSRDHVLCVASLTKQVGKLMFKSMEYNLDGDAEPALREYVARRKDKLFFSNARSVRNAVDLTRMAAANRVYTAGK